MTPDEIIEAYNVVAQDVQNRTANEAARIGNAQRSLGTLAERVASPSGQTSGLANYTYDRTMRPAVDSTVASLVTTGYANALDNNLKSSLRAAKNRYEDAKNRYTVASASGGGGGTTGGGGSNGYKEATDPSYSGGYATGDSVSGVAEDELSNRSQWYDWWLGDDLAFRGDVQQWLYEEWQNGVIDTSDYIREWYFAENNNNYLDGYSKYNPDTGTWNQNYYEGGKR